MIGIEVLVGLLSFTITALVGGVAKNIISFFFSSMIKKEEDLSYAKKISELSKQLINSSQNISQTISELSSLAAAREQSVQNLENKLSVLEEKERDLKERISHLQKIPLPVAEHLVKMLEPDSQRSARRDYLLFIAGVAVSTIVGVILEIAL